MLNSASRLLLPLCAFVDDDRKRTFKVKTHATSSSKKTSTSKMHYHPIADAKYRAAHSASSHPLPSLYRSLFQGPTPAFPAEDLAEEDLRRLEETYNLVQGELNRESSARECLARASQAMIACLKELHTALQYSSRWEGEAVPVALATILESR